MAINWSLYLHSRATLLKFKPVLVVIPLEFLPWLPLSGLWIKVQSFMNGRGEWKPLSISLDLKIVNFSLNFIFH